MFAAVLVTLGLAPDVAHAENEVVTSEPADGATLATSPSEIVFTMAEEVGDLRIVSVECNTEGVVVPEPTLSGNARVMTVEIPDANLPKGLCTAKWRVSDTDDEPNGDGQISFSIESDPTTTSTVGEDGDTSESETLTTVVGGTLSTTDATTDIVSKAAEDDPDETVDLNRVQTGTGPLWLGRVGSTLGIAVVFGGLIAIAATWPEGVEYTVTIRFMRAAWLFALLGTVLFVAAATAATTNTSLGAGFNPTSWLGLVDAGWAGRAALVRILFVLVMGWSAFRPDRVIDPVTQVAALGLPALATAMIGIDRVEGPLPVLGVALGIGHALAMAIWLGGIVLLARVVLAGSGDEDLVHAVRSFARLSVGAIVATVITGLIQMFRLDGGNLFNNGHGRVVVLKVLLVAGMVFVGLSARQFAQQRLARAHEMTAPMAQRLRRAFTIEASLGLVTLLASAWLMNLTPFNVDPLPTIDYAIERRVEVKTGETTVLDITVRLTRAEVGPSGLEVEVKEPQEGLEGLQIVLTPPDGATTGEIIQPVPLVGAGRAVRTEAFGLPIETAGDWELQINATTPLGSVTSEPMVITILTADGVVVTTTSTIPEPVLVPIEATTTTTG